jgi:hypothetical protein
MCVSEGFGVNEGFGVCVWRGSKVVFEEMPRVLKILLGGSKMAGLPKIWIKGLKQSRAGVTNITHG